MTAEETLALLSDARQSTWGRRWIDRVKALGPMPAAGALERVKWTADVLTFALDELRLDRELPLTERGALILKVAPAMIDACKVQQALEDGELNDDPPRGDS